MNLRIDPRDATDLQWRFLYAEGDIKGVRARVYEEPIYQPIEYPAELRCGDVYVVGSAHHEPSYEMNEHCVEAVARQRRVDLCLSLCTPESRRTLWLAYGAPVEATLFALCKQSPNAEHDHSQPALCNLLESSADVVFLHLGSRTRRPLRTWLEHLADGAWCGKVSSETLRALRRGAERVFLKAAREYGTASATLRKPVKK